MGCIQWCLKDIYPPELQLKVERSGNHATFLNLDITVKDGVFVYKIFDKRDAFPFFIVRIPYIDSNIQKSIFYSALVGEFHRIARSSLLYKDFNEKAMELVNRMKAQGAQSLRCRKPLSKNIRKHEKAFLKKQFWNKLWQNSLWTS